MFCTSVIRLAVNNSKAEKAGNMIHGTVAARVVMSAQLAVDKIGARVIFKRRNAVVPSQDKLK